MRLNIFSALTATALGGVMLLSSAPADAQTRRSQEDFFYYTNQQRDLRHKPRSRITVQRRSYLDPGPEVLPGEYKYRDYAEPLYYSALADAVPNQTWSRNPFNGPFDVPYKPWPGRVDWW